MSEAICGTASTRISLRYIRATRYYALRAPSYSRCQTAQSSSFPRRVSAPGFSFLLVPRLRRSFGGYVCHCPCRCEPAPQTRGGGAPGGGNFIRRALVKARTTFARRGRPGQTGTGLSALHPGDFGPAPRSPSPQLPAAPSRGRPSLPGVAPGRRRSRTSRGAVTSRGRGTPLPAPPSGSSLEDALDEQ